ncbi:hypothetical protein LOK74_08535 [Brevibacillus humidisoli]|uniref:hypothetical protein n=1 Tax=Brevibacillus humidisoli TaxID=2895522 RepID=UPI001E48B800|nr:hypothetical protein [Brevibacillus humidisoli]UFJ42522.1 hypothetical protein LOK74_08535 [Brevibacillus humidisoli]
MDMYRRHYWSLFLDFIDAFKSLNHKGIPLPLLSHFNEYLAVSKEARNELMKPGLEQHIKAKLHSNEQIQHGFDSLMKTIKRDRGSKRRSGKILLCMGGALRIPDQTLQQFFDPSQTVFVSSWKIQNPHYCGIPIHSLPDYGADVRDLTHQLATKAKAIFSACGDHPVFGNPLFQQKFLDEIPLMVEGVDAAYHYLNQVPAKCVIVGTTALMPERILTIIAASQGIPSICLQHGVVMGEPGYMPVFASKMAVYGHYEREWYLDRGVSDDCIEITGHPRFDRIFTESFMSQSHLSEQLGLHPQKKSVLIITQDNDDFWPQFVDLLVQHSWMEIIIKPHPQEIVMGRLPIYEAICEKHPSVKLLRPRFKAEKVFDFEVGLYDLLPNVDLIAVGSSTVGLEAMLFGKPVVFLNSIGDYYNQQRLDPFVQRDPEKLIQIMKGLIDDVAVQNDADKKRKAFVEYAYPVKCSGKKLMELIDKLAGA